MADLINKETTDEAKKLSSFLQVAGFLLFILSILGGFILVANSRPLAGVEILFIGTIAGAVTYGVGLLLKLAAERN